MLYGLKERFFGQENNEGKKIESPEDLMRLEEQNESVAAIMSSYRVQMNRAVTEHQLSDGSESAQGLYAGQEESVKEQLENLGYTVDTNTIARAL